MQPGLTGYGPGVSMSSGGICMDLEVRYGAMPSGGMTQASKLQQIAEFVGSLDANQTVTLPIWEVISCSMN